MPLRIVFSKHYDITCLGLERLHPFDTRKHGRAWRWLQREVGERLRECHLRVPRPISNEDLLAVHTAEYLQSLKRPQVLARALEVPVVARLPYWALAWRLLRPMRWATMGSVLAGQAAMEQGLAVNLAGGYHHAKPDRGEGFCLYADIALVVHSLRQSGKLLPDQRVVYIDLDAHQGNGVCYSFRDDRQVFLFDMHNADTYPCYDRQARERLDCDLPLPLGCRGDDYLRILKQNLPPFLDSVGMSQRLGLAIYNAGTDVFAGDPVGGMDLSAEDILDRDLFVIGQMRERGVPLVMLPSGGYTKSSYRLIAETVRRLLTES